MGCIHDLTDQPVRMASKNGSYLDRLLSYYRWVTKSLSRWKRIIMFLRKRSIMNNPVSKLGFLLRTALARHSRKKRDRTGEENICISKCILHTIIDLTTADGWFQWRTPMTSALVRRSTSQADRSFFPKNHAHPCRSLQRDEKKHCALILDFERS